MLAVLIGSTGVSYAAGKSKIIRCEFKNLQITGNLRGIKELSSLTLDENVVGDGSLKIAFEINEGRWDWKTIEGPYDASSGHNKLLSMLFMAKSNNPDKFIVEYKRTDKKPFSIGKPTGSDNSFNTMLDTGVKFKMTTSKNSSILFNSGKLLKVFATGSCERKNNNDLNLSNSSSITNDSSMKIYEKALAAERRGDYKNAVRLYEVASKQGNIYAQVNLALMYANGRNIPQNYKAAIKWFTLAADKGDRFGQFNLAQIYRLGLGGNSNQAAAFKYTRLAAKQGHPSSQYNMGNYYFFGMAVKTNYSQAIYWFKLGLNHKLPVIQSVIFLGYAYEHGAGVKTNLVKAAILYGMAKMLTSNPKVIKIYNADPNLRITSDLINKSAELFNSVYKRMTPDQKKMGKNAIDYCIKQVKKGNRLNNCINSSSLKQNQFKKETLAAKSNQSSNNYDAKIKRLEAKAKKLKIQKLEQEIAKLKQETTSQPKPARVRQRPVPVRRTPVNTRRHFADDYSCGPDDISCFGSFGDRYGSWSKRAIGKLGSETGGSGSMTETQFLLTQKILMSRLNSRKFANKLAWIALLDYGVEIAQEYDSGKLTKSQYGDLVDRAKKEVAKLGDEQDSFNSRRNAGRILSAITGALGGHLNHMRKLQLQAGPPVIRNSTDYRCTTHGKAYGVGVNRRLDLDCKPK